MTPGLVVEDAHEEFNGLERWYVRVIPTVVMNDFATGLPEGIEIPIAGIPTRIQGFAADSFVPYGCIIPAEAERQVLLLRQVLRVGVDHIGQKSRPGPIGRDRIPLANEVAVPHQLGSRSQTREYGLVGVRLDGPLVDLPEDLYLSWGQTGRWILPGVAPQNRGIKVAFHRIGQERIGRRTTILRATLLQNSLVHQRYLRGL